VLAAVLRQAVLLYCQSAKHEAAGASAR